MILLFHQPHAQDNLLVSGECCGWSGRALQYCVDIAGVPVSDPSILSSACSAHWVTQHHDNMTMITLGSIISHSLWLCPRVSTSTIWARTNHPSRRQDTAVHPSNTQFGRTPGQERDNVTTDQARDHVDTCLVDTCVVEQSVCVVDAVTLRYASA